MALMVGQEDGSSVATSVQQESDVNREEVESCYGLVLLGMSLLALFVYKKGLKTNTYLTNTYCQFLKSFLEPWLEEIRLSRLRNPIYRHDNAPSHAAKATTQYLESIGLKNKTMMIWPSNSPDLNPIENLWSIVNRRVYADGRQYSSKDAL